MKAFTFSVCLLWGLVGFSAPVHAQGAAGGSKLASLVDGVTVGGGLVSYFGDLDNNGDDNYLKSLGSSNLSLLVGADRRYGPYSVGLELNYHRLAGEQAFGSQGLLSLSFSNNLVSLNATGSIDTGLFGPGVLRPFVGVGPTLLLSPQYSGFTGDRGVFDFEKKGTRVRPNVTLGLNVQDAVRIGGTTLLDDHLDGLEGRSLPIDFALFVTVSYRFDLAH